MTDPVSLQGAEAMIALVPNADLLIDNLGIDEAKPFVYIADED